MKCPACGAGISRVVDCRWTASTNSNRRRRECLACRARYTTAETIVDARSAPAKVAQAPAVRKRAELTEASLDMVLRRLSADIDEAGAAYVVLHDGLVKFFARAGRHDAEELADKVTDVLARKISAGFEIKNVTAYARGVANLVLLKSMSLAFRDREKMRDELL